MVELKRDRCLENIVRVQTRKGQLQNRGQVGRQIRPWVHERAKDTGQRPDGRWSLEKNERNATAMERISEREAVGGGLLRRGGDKFRSVEPHDFSWGFFFPTRKTAAYARHVAISTTEPNSMQILNRLEGQNWRGSRTKGGARL